MRKLMAVLIAFVLPSVALGQQWTPSKVPYAPEAVDAYELRLRDAVKCIVGRFTSDDTVVYQIWERRKTALFDGGQGRLVKRQFDHSLIDEGIINANSAELIQFSLMEIVHPPYGNNQPQVRYLGVPNFDHPCRRYVVSIPSTRIRAVIERFLIKVDKEFPSK